MDSKPSSAFLAAPCLAIAAALFFLGTGLAPVWACTWLAAIPVLWIASRLTALQAFMQAEVRRIAATIQVGSTVRE
jgi:apolipoprotein N-acyltransferase